MTPLILFPAKGLLVNLNNVIKIEFQIVELTACIFHVNGTRTFLQGDDVTALMMEINGAGIAVKRVEIEDCDPDW